MLPENSHPFKNNNNNMQDKILMVIYNCVSIAGRVPQPFQLYGLAQGDGSLCVAGKDGAPLEQKWSAHGHGHPLLAQMGMLRANPLQWHVSERLKDRGLETSVCF